MRGPIRHRGGAFSLPLAEGPWGACCAQPNLWETRHEGVRVLLCERCGQAAAELAPASLAAVGAWRALVAAEVEWARTSADRGAQFLGRVRRCKSDGDSLTVELEMAPREETGFEPWDDCELRQGSQAWTGVVSRIDGLRVTLSIPFAPDEPEVRADAFLVHAKGLGYATSVLDALTSPEGEARLRQLTSTSELDPITTHNWDEAVTTLASGGILGIEGVAGCGKSTILSKTIVSLLKRGVHVCGVAPTERAASAWKRGVIEQLGQLEGGRLEMWGHRRAIQEIQRQRYDFVAIDDAGLLSVPHCAALSMLGDKVLIAGDSWSLAPRLFAPTNRGHHLAVPSISVFKEAHPSRVFELHESRRLSFASSLLAPLLTAGKAPRVPAAEWSGILWLDADVEGSQDVCPDPITEKSFGNPVQLGLAQELVTHFMHRGIPTSKISYVTPFRLQARAFQALADAMPHGHGVRIPILTVDSAVGHENEFVIFDLGTANAKAAHESARRIYVGATRAKRATIVIGPRPFNPPTSPRPSPLTFLIEKSVETLEMEAEAAARAHLQSALKALDRLVLRPQPLVRTLDELFDHPQFLPAVPTPQRQRPDDPVKFVQSAWEKRDSEPELAKARLYDAIACLTWSPHGPQPALLYQDMIGRRELPTDVNRQLKILIRSLESGENIPPQRGAARTLALRARRERIRELAARSDLHDVLRLKVYEVLTAEDD